MKETFARLSYKAGVACNDHMEWWKGKLHNDAFLDGSRQSNNADIRLLVETFGGDTDCKHEITRLKKLGETHPSIAAEVNAVLFRLVRLLPQDQLLALVNAGIKS